MSDKTEVTSGTATDKVADLKARAEASRQAAADAQRREAAQKQREAAADRVLAELASAAGFDGSKPEVRKSVSETLATLSALLTELSELTRERERVPRSDSALRAEFDDACSAASDKLAELTENDGNLFLADVASIRTHVAVIRARKQFVPESDIAEHFVLQITRERLVEISIDDANARNKRIADSRKSGTRLSPEDAREAYKVNGKAFLPSWITKDGNPETAQKIAQIRIISRELDHLRDEYWRMRDVTRKTVERSIGDLDTQRHGTLTGTDACLVRLGEFTRENPWYHDRAKTRATTGPVWFEREAGAKAGKLLGATDGMKKTIEVVTCGNLVAIDEKGRIQACEASGRQVRLEDWQFSRLVKFVKSLLGDVKPAAEAAEPSETRRAYSSEPLEGPTAMQLAIAQSQAGDNDEAPRRKRDKKSSRNAGRRGNGWRGVTNEDSE